MVLKKQPVVLVPRVYNIAQRTIVYWLARYRYDDWYALAENTRKGCPTKVSGEDMKWLFVVIHILELHGELYFIAVAYYRVSKYLL